MTLPNTEIIAARGPKNSVDTDRPYAMHVEAEYSHAGVVEDVATVFLTNKECPYRCLMCDLWRNTVDKRVPLSAVPSQIQHALDLLPPAQHIKLYNSGNFFDAQAIPPEDLSAIANLICSFKTVIVENHPKLCNKRVAEFQQLCGTQLEVALGLETSHEPTLARLNKEMTTADFANACEFLIRHEIRVRAFILLRPPWTTEVRGIERAIDSVRFAYDCGVECCAVIPTRSGNGIMDKLQATGEFQPPRLESLETVMNEVVGWKRGRIFADLWDAQQFGSCPHCVQKKIERLRQINLTQESKREIDCRCAGNDET